jgi:hypothetical protein
VLRHLNISYTTSEKKKNTDESRPMSAFLFLKMDTSNQNPHNEFVNKINPLPLPCPFNVYIYITPAPFLSHSIMKKKFYEKNQTLSPPPCTCQTKEIKFGKISTFLKII